MRRTVHEPPTETLAEIDAAIQLARNTARVARVAGDHERALIADLYVDTLLDHRNRHRTQETP